MSAQHPLFTEKQSVSEAPNDAFTIDYHSHLGLALCEPLMCSRAAQLNEVDSDASIHNRSKL